MRYISIRDLKKTGLPSMRRSDYLLDCVRGEKTVIFHGNAPSVGATARQAKLDCGAPRVFVVSPANLAGSSSSKVVPSRDHVDSRLPPNKEWNDVRGVFLLYQFSLFSWKARVCSCLAIHRRIFQEFLSLQPRRVCSAPKHS